MTAFTDQNATSVRIDRTVDISAPVRTVYGSLLEQLGPGSGMPDGTPMPMKLEPWPGGRWFRDLGDNTGHWWGTVQVIKPPTLIEIAGPLFMSYPAMSHIQYRLTDNAGGTTLQFVHRAFGELDPDHIAGVSDGWDYQLSRIRLASEGALRQPRP